MNIVVCIKKVPDIVDAEIEIDRKGQSIDTEDLEFDINEWDNYAVEEAVRLKEALGGHVTAVTLGDEDSEDVLRQALAMGADEAILIDEEGFEQSDARGIVRGLYGAIRDLSFDLILTGVQSADDGWGQVGGMLAEMAGVPYASLVVKIDVSDAGITVLRELESNTLEKTSLPLPALVTVQTGINKPRYVSIMGIKKVRKIEIRETDADDLDIDEDDIGAAASSVASRKYTLPSSGGQAEMITGALNEICDRTARIIREKGGLA